MASKKQVNNKGFSLVELIVVVLIMSIIAVSLAPQVMKWVNNARIAVDRQTADSVVSIARLALTDQKAQGRKNCSCRKRARPGLRFPEQTRRAGAFRIQAICRRQLSRLDPQPHSHHVRKKSDHRNQTRRWKNVRRHAGHPCRKRLLQSSVR